MKLPLFEDTGGKNSASFTMMIVGFIIVSAWLVISMFSLNTREFSASEAMAYLTPLYALYFSRRWVITSQTLKKTPEELSEEKDK